MSTNIQDNPEYDNYLKDALDQNDYKGVLLNIERGANVNTKNKEGRNALTFVIDEMMKEAALNKRAFEVIKYLIEEKGVDLKVKGKDGQDNLSNLIKLKDLSKKFKDEEFANFILRLQQKYLADAAILKKPNLAAKAPIAAKAEAKGLPRKEAVKPVLPAAKTAQPVAKTAQPTAKTAAKPDNKVESKEAPVTKPAAVSKPAEKPPIPPKPKVKEIKSSVEEKPNKEFRIENMKAGFRQAQAQVPTDNQQPKKIITGRDTTKPLSQFHQNLEKLYGAKVEKPKIPAKDEKPQTTSTTTKSPRSKP